ncbi:MAG TPA: hypothetical protein PLB35_05305 [Myxococcota bacterium]|nr:hypothetical protein [Myxococcota bacterium]HOH76653.1 hypothetical protein [Myxococcota bacterium]
MERTTSKRLDLGLAVGFVVLTIAFVVAAFVSDAFMQWVFARHHNVASWYIRPLFLIPLCFFAYRRSWAGVFGTLFAVLTSMFWFPAPAVIDPQVATFLKMEQEYLTGDWGAWKILLTSLVPVSLAGLVFAFWKRSLWLGIGVIVFIAAAKMLWSVAFGGESGRTVLAPAIIALVVCVAAVWLGFRRLHRN